MVLKPEPVVEAIEAIAGPANVRKVLLTPQGAPFTQKTAEELTCFEQIVLVCGRYEGVDERIRFFVDQEISIGDYILNGGEVAALVVLETVSRLTPGVIGKQESVADDSFTTGFLEYPHYTRPENFRGLTVPETLLSGNHQEIKMWRRHEALKRTMERRPDLLDGRRLSEEEEAWLRRYKKQLV